MRIVIKDKGVTCERDYVSVMFEDGYELEIKARVEGKKIDITRVAFIKGAGKREIFRFDTYANNSITVQEGVTQQQVAEYWQAALLYVNFAFKILKNKKLRYAHPILNQTEYLEKFKKGEVKVNLGK